MPNQKVPERTIAVLNLGRRCLLTLTHKHLRGQILRLVDGHGLADGRTLIKDQVDILLSGIAGYTIEHKNNFFKRVVSAIIAGFTLYFMAKSFVPDFFASPKHDANIILGFNIAIGAIGAIIGWLCYPDRYAFSINIMGSYTLIPIVRSQSPVVQDFITKLQNAKIAYEEM